MFHCGVSLNKQWRMSLIAGQKYGSLSRDMVTCISSAVQSRLSYLLGLWPVYLALFNLGWATYYRTPGLLSGCGYMRDNFSSCTSCTPWSIFCPGLTQSMFFCSAVSAARCALWRLFYVSFPLLFAVPSCELLQNTIVLYRQLLKREQDGYISTTVIRFFFVR